MVEGSITLLNKNSSSFVVTVPTSKILDFWSNFLGSVLPLKGTAVFIYERLRLFFFSSCSMA